MYGNKQIANELQATAMGDADYGNALYVAKDISSLTPEDVQLLERYLRGSEGGRDFFALQDLAIKIYNMQD